MCLAYWGVPRATKDLDLNVFREGHGPGPVFEALEAAGYEVQRSEALARGRERGDFVARWGDMRVDVFVASMSTTPR